MLHERKLRRWHEAGLVDDATVARILAWERQQERPWLLYALGGLGALTVALGFLAIIASNWEAIGPAAKLGADVLVGAGLGFALVRADARGARWVREILIIVLYGWTIASIGLVSQIYNMGGETWKALGLWIALTALLATRGASGFVASLFYLGIGCFFIAVITAAHGHRSDPGWTAGLAMLYPAALLLASGSRWIARVRPAFARTAGAFGWTLLLIGVSTLPLLFYGRWDGQDTEKHFASIAIGAALVLVLLVMAPRLIAPLVEGEVPPRAAVLLRALFGLLLSVGVAAVVLPHGKIGIVGALSFIALWILVAAFAHALDQRRLLNTATAVIGLRVLIVYFEVFGSLLSTGLGLITGGLFTLLLVWLWVRKSLRRAPATSARPDGADEPRGDEIGGAL